MSDGNQIVAQLLGATKKYGDTVALDNVSLDIGAGGVVAILGPNGAGKTTTVKLLLGLVPPTSGKALLFGKDPKLVASRQRIGAMLQVAKVPETLRVREHIELFRSYYPKPLSESEVIELGGLNGIENRKFGELSGGQRQRVLFALALCGDPEVLFLDEPTLGFDVEVRRAFWNQIRGFVGRGRTVVLTTHYLEEADALADRVVVIDHGRIIADGTPSQIKSRVTGKRIVCSTSLSELEIAAIAGVTSSKRDGARMEIFTGSAESVVRELLSRDAALTDLEVISLGLEDAFLSLIRSGEAA